MNTTLKRLKNFRTILSKNNIGAMLISQPENRYYLSGFSGSAGYLLITADSQSLATDFRYVEQVKQQSPDYRLFESRGDMAKWFPEFIADSNLEELTFEADDLNFERYSKLKTILVASGIELKPSSGLAETQRSIKDSAEIRLIEQAVAISDAAIEYAAKTARPGMTELQLAWEIEKHMREHGSQAVPFEVIVAAGENAALPHHLPSDYVIREGEPIVMDIGAKREGYASDLTRTICLGKEDAQFRRIYNIVFRAQVAAEENIRSGMSGAEADAIARRIISEAGFSEYFGHGLGHGVGLAVHEKPHVGATSGDILSDGMVFTVEPGIYLPGWGGIRIEDTVMLENGKIRVLSASSK